MVKLNYKKILIFIILSILLIALFFQQPSISYTKERKFKSDPDIYYLYKIRLNLPSRFGIYTTYTGSLFTKNSTWKNEFIHRMIGSMMNDYVPLSEIDENTIEFEINNKIYQIDIVDYELYLKEVK